MACEGLLGGICSIHKGVASTPKDALLWAPVGRAAASAKVPCAHAPAVQQGQLDQKVLKWLMTASSQDLLCALAWCELSERHSCSSSNQQYATYCKFGLASPAMQMLRMLALHCRLGLTGHARCGGSSLFPSSCEAASEKQEFRQRRQAHHLATPWQPKQASCAGVQSARP